MKTELAALLDLPVEALDDKVSLRGGLALDSLSMMRVVTWLESRGVSIAAEEDLPATVGELLSLLDTAPPFKLRLGGVPGLPQRFAAVPPPDPMVPVLETAALRLAPPIPDDLGFLYALAVQPETGFRWRYRGSVPPFERFKAAAAQVLAFPKPSTSKPSRKIEK